MIAVVILIAIAVVAAGAVYAMVANYGVRTEKAPSFSITSVVAEALPDGGLYVSVQVTNTGAVPVTIGSITTLVNGKVASISYSGIGTTVGAGSTVTFSGYATSSVGASVGSSCEVIVKATANGGTYESSQTVLVT